jgi:hypothetical protein
MFDYEAEAAKAQPLVDGIKATLLRYEMFTGAYDRLWKMLEAHEIDVRCPGDGTFIPAERWIEIAGWLGRTVERYYAKPASEPTFKVNRFAGPCALCGATVEPEAGRILRKDAGQNGWDVLHLVGECPAGLNPPTAKDHADELPAPKGYAGDFSLVTGGYYATVSPRSDQDYDFWFVKEGRKPGFRFVKRVIGGSGPIRISGPEAIRALKTILSEGVDVCGNRFADEMERCRDCGLPLTDERSRAARRGPVCRSK